MGRSGRPTGGRGALPILRSLLLCALLAGVAGGPVCAETWRGLVVAPEHRCSAYDRKRDYPYPQSVEHDIVARMGAIYGPYTGRYFSSVSETDIEHIVATSEAHDSGLCRRGPETRARFARDLRNLTLASPRVNRHLKRGKDAADWLPDRNRCWFAGRVLEVRLAYGLSIDRREADALDAVFAACGTIPAQPALYVAGTAPGSRQAVAHTRQAPSPEPGGSVLGLYDDNGNGRITCSEARRHGIAPVHRDHPAYRFMRDGDGDGVVCE